VIELQATLFSVESVEVAQQQSVQMINFAHRQTHVGKVKNMIPHSQALAEIPKNGT
jgi:hypothetical protein